MTTSYSSGRLKSILEGEGLPVMASTTGAATIEMAEM
jgi:hypothetical protein